MKLLLDQEFFQVFFPSPYYICNLLGGGGKGLLDLSIFPCDSPSLEKKFVRQDMGVSILYFFCLPLLGALFLLMFEKFSLSLLAFLNVILSIDEHALRNILYNNSSLLFNLGSTWLIHLNDSLRQEWTSTH